MADTMPKAPNTEAYGGQSTKILVKSTTSVVVIFLLYY